MIVIEKIMKTSSKFKFVVNANQNDLYERQLNLVDVLIQIVSCEKYLRIVIETTIMHDDIDNTSR